MSTLVFFAVILAALCHAGWNALVKSGADKHLNMAAIIMGHVPPALILLPFTPLPAPESWPFLAYSVVLHVGYQLFLLNSYRLGDLTQVYPIARGSAPLLVAGVSVIWLGVDLNRMEMLAILTIGLGILSMSLVRRHDGMRNSRAAWLAFGTGCFIAGYSLVDGTGARLSGTALGFFAWLAIANAATYAIIISITQPGLLARVPREAGHIMAIGGTGSYVAYALVMWAFTKAPIALVTALRETSIVFALLIGVFFLKERMDLARVLSTAATLGGAILLRFARS